MGLETWGSPPYTPAAATFPDVLGGPNIGMETWGSPSYIPATGTPPELLGASNIQMQTWAPPPYLPAVGTSSDLNEAVTSTASPWLTPPHSAGAAAPPDLPGDVLDTGLALSEFVGTGTVTQSGVPISRRMLGPGSHVLTCRGSILPALGSGVKGGGLMNPTESVGHIPDAYVCVRVPWVAGEGPCCSELLATSRTIQSRQGRPRRSSCRRWLCAAPAPVPAPLPPCPAADAGALSTEPRRCVSTGPAMARLGNARQDTLGAARNITLQWRAGDLACRLLMYLRLLAMYASAFVTVVISLDRQAAILRPLAIARARARNRAMLQAAWALSAGLAVPQLFVFHTITLRPPHNFTQCTTRGSFPRRWHETLYNMLGFACLFLLPLLIMVCCYARILLEISRRMGSGLFSSQDASLRCSRNNIPRARLRMNNIPRARMRMLRMSLVIVSSFILCWTPYYLLGLWHWFCPRAMEERVSPALSHILFIFGLFNACLDPITYGLFTIPLRGRWGCPCRHAPPPPPPSPATGSFRCSASSLPARRGAQGGRGSRGAARDTSCHSSSL
ncbi:PREDICTED: uncharacterized protein LOC101811464 [Ficedula albicollis]|uniref:uncharacterized protein LOC101811464 n=1 Tax=Ficedula albicollis TaxID=59894 RepID=UPI00035A242B|nr:PREDICTED: uncharacterized protein LOC101811464 [Ficedula albicollis]